MINGIGEREGLVGGYSYRFQRRNRESDFGIEVDCFFVESMASFMERKRTNKKKIKNGI